jgi:hypothetical protein
MTELEELYRQIESRVRYDNADDDWTYESAMRRLVPAERVLWTTRFLERELADGGWYLVFADEREYLIRPAIRAYQRLGLSAYAAHLRDVLASGYGDNSSDIESERLDEAFDALSGADATRAEFALAQGLLKVPVSAGS